MTTWRMDSTSAAELAVETLRGRGLRCSGDAPPRPGEYTVRLSRDGRRWEVEWRQRRSAANRKEAA